MPKIFISYRRDDSAAQAGRLYDRLEGHFGQGQVFMDVDAIKPGVYSSLVQKIRGGADLATSVFNNGSLVNVIAVF